MRYGPTLSLTPYASMALSLEETRDLAARTVRLHCRMSAGESKYAWTIRVESWAQAISGPAHRTDVYHAKGHLADLMHSALDEYERAYVYSPDELFAIQQQTSA